MTRFMMRRCGLALVTLFAVSIMSFVLAQVVPGNVGRTILGRDATAAQVAQVNHELGADRPLVVRYSDWVTKFCKGNWGRSYLLDLPVRALVLERLRNSLILGAFAFLLAVPLSVALGVFAALRAESLSDRLISASAYAFVALPEFVSGLLLLIVFGLKLGWFPVSSTVPQANVGDVVRQLTLPALPMFFLLLAYISGIARSGMIDTLREDYTRTAILKGLPRRRVLIHHTLRNGLAPTVAVVAVQSASLLTGLVVIETLFNYPGVARLTLDSAVQHDVPVFAACVFVVALVFIALNLVADIGNALLVPRARVGDKPR